MNTVPELHRRKPRKLVPPKERFWAKVKKTDSCWIWMGSKDPFGYGHFYFDGKINKAHHFLVKDKKPPNLWVLHHCDNPACVNPDHLFFGNAKDNWWDMSNKGRANFMPGFKAMKEAEPSFKGELNPKSKLTEKDIAYIRSHKKRGCTVRLSKQFGVAHSTISSIINRTTWRHIP